MIRGDHHHPAICVTVYLSLLDPLGRRVRYSPRTTGQHSKVGWLGRAQFTFDEETNFARVRERGDVTAMLATLHDFLIAHYPPRSPKRSAFAVPAPSFCWYCDIPLDTDEDLFYLGSYWKPICLDCLDVHCQARHTAAQDEQDKYELREWVELKWYESMDGPTDGGAGSFGCELAYETDQNEEDDGSLEDTDFEDDAEAVPTSRLDYESTANYDTDDFEPGEYEAEDRSPPDEDDRYDDDSEPSFVDGAVDESYWVND